MNPMNVSLARTARLAAEAARPVVFTSETGKVNRLILAEQRAREARGRAFQARVDAGLACHVCGEDGC